MATPSPTPTTNGSVSTQASRIRGFAAFFKSYMSVWTLVVAALPIPIGAFKLIPSFEAQRSYLSVYTSLFCFLILGFIFFRRHRLGYYMFREPSEDGDPSVAGGITFRQIWSTVIRGIINWLPLACVFLSVYAVFRYHNLLSDAILIAQAQATAEEERGSLPSAFLLDMAEPSTRANLVGIAKYVLAENRITLAALGEKTGDDAASATISEAAEKAGRFRETGWFNVRYLANGYLSRAAPTSSKDLLVEAQKFMGAGAKVPGPDEVLKTTRIVPLGSDLMLWYLTIFVAAETAFILMALKEYLQDLAHISDLSLMEIDAQPADKVPN